MATATNRTRRGQRWTLGCPSCPRRITWYSEDRGWSHFQAMLNGEPDRMPWWVEDMPLGWGWQGKRSPIHWRQTAEGQVIDVECFHCGWSALGVPYPGGLNEYMVRG